MLEIPRDILHIFHRSSSLLYSILLYTCLIIIIISEYINPAHFLPCSVGLSVILGCAPSQPMLL